MLSGVAVLRIVKSVCVAAVLLLAAPAFAAPHESVVYDFGATPEDGFSPQHGLVADSVGNLYGTTIAGGLPGAGTIFKIDPLGVETILYTFQGGADGSGPTSDLAFDKKGNLYGTTQVGGDAGQGTVFELKAPRNGSGAWTYRVLHVFCLVSGCPDGRFPTAGVTVSKTGVVYGTAVLGGQGAFQTGQGTAFELDPPVEKKSDWVFKTIHAFCNQGSCVDGAQPYAGHLLLMPDGTMYGTTRSGGGGVIYRLTPNGFGGFGYTVLHLFSVSDGQGAGPLSAVAVDKNGVLYGTTSQGGAHNCGAAYSFDPLGLQYKLLYSFCDQQGDGSTIYGGLFVDNGKHGPTLYGAALGGGANSKGTIYRITPPKTVGDPWLEKTLYSFCPIAGCADGQTPGFGSLVQVDGDLYGTTTGGGANAAGTVFRFQKK